MSSEVLTDTPGCTAGKLGIGIPGHHGITSLTGHLGHLPVNTEAFYPQYLQQTQYPQAFPGRPSAHMRIAERRKRTQDGPVEADMAAVLDLSRLAFPP